MNSSIYGEYREAKEKYNKYKKIVDSLGKRLKEEMVDYPKVIEDGYVYERKVQVRRKLDEEGLIEYLKNSEFSGVLDTKCIVNEEKLSNLLESGEFDMSIMDNFINNVEVVTLYCKKDREEKEIDNGTF